MKRISVLLFLLIFSHAWADNRVKVVVDGEVILADDWNAEFDNIYADVTHTIAGTWTFTKSGTPITIQPGSAPSANTVLLDINNASSANIFSVDHEGDVVIGNTSGNPSLTLTATTSSITAINFNDGSSDGIIRYDHGNRTLNFFAGGSGGMLLSSSLLHAFNVDVAVKSNNASSAVLELRTNSTGNADIDFNDGSDAGRIRYDHTNDTMDFFAGGSGGMLLSSSLLRTYGVDVVVKTNSASSAVVELRTTSTGNADIDFNDGSDAGRIRYDHTNDTMDFYRAGSEQMTLTSDGLIVGATTTEVSGANLSVRGSMAIDDADSDASTLGFSVGFGGANINSGKTGSGTYLPIKFFTGAVERMRIHESKPVLIMDEADANAIASDMDANDSVAIYTKSNKFVIAYNNGGTATYLSIDLDGSDTTWTHSTTEP